MKEEFKPIPGYEGLYEISNHGNVWSIPRINSGRRFGGYKISVSQGRSKYKQVQLSKNGVTTPFLVHRLVALAFVPNPNNLPCVNHKDEDKANNRADNLEWCTYSYNCNYGTRNERIKSNSPRINKVLQLNQRNEVISEYDSMHDASNITGINVAHICDCCHGKRDSAGKFMWRFKDECYHSNSKKIKLQRLQAKKDGYRKVSSALSKEVLQCNINGCIIKRFASTVEASKHTGIATSGIINACNGKYKQSGGFIWMYAKDQTQTTLII